MSVNVTDNKKIACISTKIILLAILCGLLSLYIYLLVDFLSMTALSDIVLNITYIIGYKTEYTGITLTTSLTIGILMILVLIFVMFTAFFDIYARNRKTAAYMNLTAACGSAIFLILYGVLSTLDRELTSINTYNTDWTVYIDTPSSPHIDCDLYEVAVVYTGNLTNNVGYDIPNCIVYAHASDQNESFTQCCASYDTPSTDIKEINWTFVVYILIFQSIFIVIYSIIAAIEFCSGKIYNIEPAKIQNVELVEIQNV